MSFEPKSFAPGTDRDYGPSIGEDEQRMPLELSALAAQLRDDAEMLSTSYPVQANKPRLQSAEKPRQRRWGLALSVGALATSAAVCLAVTLVAFTRTNLNSESAAIRSATAEVATRDDPSPELPPVPSTADRIPPPDGDQVWDDLAAVFPASDEVLEAGDLTDKEKIAMLEQALEQYRAVIVYMQDELARRDDQRKAETCLREFLRLVAADKHEQAYSLVSPRSKEQGDPTAYRTPLDYHSYAKEVGTADVAAKFNDYLLQGPRITEAGDFEFPITFAGWDNDRAIVTRIKDKFYVTNPINLAR